MQMEREQTYHSLKHPRPKEEKNNIYIKTELKSYTFQQPSPLMLAVEIWFSGPEYLCVFWNHFSDAQFTRNHSIDIPSPIELSTILFSYLMFHIGKINLKTNNIIIFPRCSRYIPSIPPHLQIFLSTKIYYLFIIESSRIPEISKQSLFLQILSPYLLQNSYALSVRKLGGICVLLLS